MDVIKASTGLEAMRYEERNEICIEPFVGSER
jgi:hypothetical protein